MRSRPQVTCAWSRWIYPSYSTPCNIVIVKAILQSNTIKNSSKSFYYRLQHLLQLTMRYGANTVWCTPCNYLENIVFDRRSPDFSIISTHGASDLFLIASQKLLSLSPKSTITLYSECTLSVSCVFGVRPWDAISLGHFYIFICRCFRLNSSFSSRSRRRTHEHIGRVAAYFLVPLQETPTGRLIHSIFVPQMPRYIFIHGKPPLTVANGERTFHQYSVRCYTVHLLACILNLK